MQNKKVTLVLGAGSSLAMGYPLGADLRKEIIDDTLKVYSDKIVSINKGFSFEDLEKFVHEFKYSQMLSIDSFLARRPEFLEIGKRTIAAILLSKEDKNKLQSSDHKDHWLMYFYNKITTDKWDSLDFSNISIITFNYDRSFENYLAYALKHTYGKTINECFNKIQEFRIIHIYGSLGDIYPTDNNYFEYGRKTNKEQIVQAASKINVIPEGRDESLILKKAGEILNESQSIGFLGFSFDATNLNRLNTKSNCQHQVVNSKGTFFRDVYATCYGMKKMEIQKAVSIAVPDLPDQIIPNHFKDCNCLDLLKESLILG